MTTACSVRVEASYRKEKNRSTALPCLALSSIVLFFKLGGEKLNDLHVYCNDPGEFFQDPTWIL